MLTSSRSQLTSLASKVGGVNMIAVKLQMEEDEFVPVGLDLGLTSGAAKDMIAEEEKGEHKNLFHSPYTYVLILKCGISEGFTQRLYDSISF